MYSMSFSTEQSTSLNRAVDALTRRGAFTVVSFFFKLVIELLGEYINIEKTFIFHFF